MRISTRGSPPVAGMSRMIRELVVGSTLSVTMYRRPADAITNLIDRIETQRLSVSSLDIHQVKRPLAFEIPSDKQEVAPARSPTIQESRAQRVHVRVQLSNLTSLVRANHWNKTLGA